MKKKIVSVMMLSIYFLGGFWITFAYTDINGHEQVGPPTEQQKMLDEHATTWSKDWNDSWWATTVTVTEKIPGMDCGDNIGSANDPEHRKYKCTIQPGFGSVMLILKGLIKYTTFIVALIGGLMLVVSWVQYSMSGASGDAKKHATERIHKVLAGIILLFLIGFILNSVAPWIYR